MHQVRSCRWLRSSTVVVPSRPLLTILSSRDQRDPILGRRAPFSEPGNPAGNLESSVARPAVRGYTMTLCQFDDGAECKRSSCHRWGSESCGARHPGGYMCRVPHRLLRAPLPGGPRILSSVRHNSDPGPPGIGEIIILYLPRFSFSASLSSLRLSSLPSRSRFLSIYQVTTKFRRAVTTLLLPNHRVAGI